MFEAAGSGLTRLRDARNRAAGQTLQRFFGSRIVLSPQRLGGADMPRVGTTRAPFIRPSASDDSVILSKQSRIRENSCNSLVAPKLDAAGCLKNVFDKIWRQADVPIVSNQHIQKMQAPALMPSSPIFLTGIRMKKIERNG